MIETLLCVCLDFAEIACQMPPVLIVINPDSILNLPASGDSADELLENQQ